jgi:tellurite resistance protein TehA-like permease
VSRAAWDEGHPAIDPGPAEPPAEARPAPPLASEPLPPGLVGQWLATLDPGYFAWVMGSGIISVGGALLGVPLLSEVALGVTIAAFFVLTWAYAMRVVRFHRRFRMGLRDPTVAMAYFTVVAGTDVLAIRIQMAGHATVALGLGAAAFCAWLVLTYGLPWSIVAAAHHPVLGQFNGT